MFPLFLTSLILHQVVVSFQYYDCYDLRTICKADPGCGDVTVFFTKCVSYIRNQYGPSYLKKGTISYNGVRGSHNKQIQSLRKVYTDYQRAALRESLYLLKKRLHNQNTGGEDSNISEERKHSKRDSTDLNINNIPLNTAIEAPVSSEKDIASTKRRTKTIYNSLGQEVVPSKDFLDNSFQVSGKRDIIDKAFDLVQSLINEHERDKESVVGDVATEKVKRKIDSQDSTSTEVPSSKRNTNTQSEIDRPDKSPVKDRVTLDDKYVGKNRIEIATPVYGSSDELLEEEGEEKRSDNSEDQVRSELVNGQDRGLLVLKSPVPFSQEKAIEVGKELSILLWNLSHHEVFQLQHVNNNNAEYRMKVDPSWFKSDENVSTVVKRINTDKEIRTGVNKNTGTTILLATTNQKNIKTRVKAKKHWSTVTLFSAIVAGSVIALFCVVIIVGIIKRKGKGFSPLIFRKQEAVQDYQELCRTQMSIVNSPHPEEDSDKNGIMKNWNDNQSPYNMDITTGHVILSYMEDHLSNEDRLNEEWDALCAYKADDCTTLYGSDPRHATKNRYRDVLPYDHTRVKLHESSNAFHSDYINANFITDSNPKSPSYIATQGPLDNTVADFWQMVWEQGVVVIINLTRLSDVGLPQCHRYWPADGSETYHIYEVNLISEHIWCDDYLVRSLYLKNLLTADTRTVTQFHYLTWPDQNVPSSPSPLLEFRRKVNKSYRGHACPVVVHCNNGIGRSGTYILLDMVLNRMIKGTKEIDIAATLEHLRDQRQDLVKTKGQFEFALLAVAQEVSAILDAANH